MPFFLSLLSSDDSRLGRPDTHSMSHQTLMELFIADTGNKSLITETNGNPHDISQWAGVMLNDSKEVTEIGLAGAGLVGHFAFQWLPPTVCQIRITSLKHVSGTIDLALFPPLLTLIDLSVNFFSGELNLNNLPPNMVTFAVFENKLTGNISLTLLPESLEWLNISSNSFSGEICLTRLPSKLWYLCVEKNLFSGNLDLSGLPNGLKMLNISQNGFEGKADFSKLPESLSLLNVSETALEGEINKTNVRKTFLSKNSKVSVISQ